MGRRRHEAARLERHSLHALKAALQECVRLGFDPARDPGLRRAAVRRVVLEPTVLGRIVRWRDHDTVGQPRRAPAIVGEDGVRDRRRRRVVVALRQHHVDAVGGQHFERARPPGADSACVSMPRKSGPSMPLPCAVMTDRLRDGEHVPLVERFQERRTPGALRCRTRPAAREWRDRALRCNTHERVSETSTRIASGAGLPARGLIFMTRDPASRHANRSSWASPIVLTTIRP